MIGVTLGASVLGFGCASNPYSKGNDRVHTANEKTKTDGMLIEPIHVWMWIESALGLNVVGYSLHHVFHSVNFHNTEA